MWTEILKDPAGKLSLIRVATIVYMLAVAVAWAWISIKEGYMIDLNPQVKDIMLYLLGGKTVQSFSESWKGQLGKSAQPQ